MSWPIPLQRHVIVKSDHDVKGHAEIIDVLALTVVNVSLSPPAGLLIPILVECEVQQLLLQS